MKTTALMVLLTTVAAFPLSAQTVAIFDTVFYSDTHGSRIATMYVPSNSIGVGVVLGHWWTGERQTMRCWAESLAAHGYVAMAFDYFDFNYRTSICKYPKPVTTFKLAVEFLRRGAQQFGVTTGKIVGLGQSEGAIHWGQSIVWDNDDEFFGTDPTVNDRLDAVVLLYGAFDTENFLQAADFHMDGVWEPYFSATPDLRYTKGNAIANVANITTPVLLFHGQQDRVIRYEHSVAFHDSLIAHGKVSELHLVDGGHTYDVPLIGPKEFTAQGLITKDIVLEFLRRTVAPASRIRLSSSSIHFGPLLVSASDTAVVRVENIGDSTLTMHSISNSHAEYTLLNVPSLPFAIQPGSFTQFRVAFQPVGEGAVDDTVHLESDDPLHPVAAITLDGKGIASVSPARAGVLYTTSSATPEVRLLSMNIADGTVDTIGPMGVPEIWAMSIRHSDGMIYGTSITPAPTGVYVISGTSGEAALLRRLPIANLSALAFSPGDTLYGATTTGSLYRMDLASGHVDSLGTSVGLVYSGLSFRPRTGDLWASVRYPIDSIFTLNRDNGTATLVGATGFYALTSSITFDPSGTLYGLIDNGSGEDYLATIDTVTASGSIIAGPLPVTYLRITLMGETPAVSVEDSPHSGTPLQFALSQNYPNPFNPSTVISYQLPVVSNVKLIIYDLLGREVATLVNAVEEPGYKSVEWNAAAVASGVYFYRLKAGDFMQTKKLLLTK